MDLREQHQQKEGASRHPWEKARLRVISRLLQKTAAPSTILDVGCGDAYVLGNLAEEGFGDTFWGVDNAVEEAYSFKRGEREIQVVSSLDDLPKESMGPLSHVLLLDVLEHVEDDVDLLKTVQAHPHVDSGCIFLLTVPAHPGLFTQHDRILGHHRRYTAHALQHAVQDAGLILMEDGAFFASLLAPRALEKIMERFWGSSQRETTDLSAWYGSKIKTQLIENILYADFLISHKGQSFGFGLPGLSQYAICAAP